MEEEEFKAGDRIQIVRSGCNNTGAPEGGWDNCLDKGETIYTVERVEKGGKYSSRDLEYYTLILNTGNPIWHAHCKKVECSIRNNYQIF